MVDRGNGGDIAVTEQTIWIWFPEIMKSPPAPEKREAVKGKEGDDLTVIPDRSRKAQAPERSSPTGKWATRAASPRIRSAPREGDHLRDRDEGRPCAITSRIIHF